MLESFWTVWLCNDQFQLLNDKLEVADAISSHLLFDQKTDREGLCQKKDINSLHDVGDPLAVHSVLITITYSETKNSIPCGIERLFSWFLFWTRFFSIERGRDCSLGSFIFGMHLIIELSHCLHLWMVFQCAFPKVIRFCNKLYIRIWGTYLHRHSNITPSRMYSTNAQFPWYATCIV